MTDRHKLRKELKTLQRKLQKKRPVCLYNKDFKDGTYIIDQPGHYKLCQNIVFKPNEDNDFRPKADQVEYQTRGYSLGFFAAISIKANDVLLDLNGYSLEQSREHYLQQRFFALIELADSPFIPTQGPLPGQGEGIACAENVIITNGYLGLSSHHSIHGNFNKKVLLEKLCMVDFEIAAVALNGADGVLYHKLHIGPNNHRVPILATYSAGRFAQQYAMEVLNRFPDLDPVLLSRVRSSMNVLEDRMAKVFREIMKYGNTRDPLFQNVKEIPDGNTYGILFHTPGVAVDDFITENVDTDFTENVYLSKVCIQGLKASINEVIALSGKDGKGIQNDVAGAVFQIEKVTGKDGRYKANPVADLQLVLAEVSLAVGGLGKSNITQDTIDWSRSGSSIDVLLEKGYVYKCNGDSMFHVNKGVMAYRLDGVKNAELYKCSCYGITNYGRLGNEKLAGAYAVSHDQQKREGYHGTACMGYVFSYCSKVELLKSLVCDIVSKHGDATGVKIINDSQDIDLYKCQINGVKAGSKKGVNYYGEYVEYTDDLPNSMPDAIGVEILQSTANLKCVDICNLSAKGKEIPVYIEE